MNTYTIEVKRDYDFTEDFESGYKIFSAWNNYKGDINACGDANNLFEDFKIRLKEEYDLTINDIIFLPMYVYSHSGETFNTTGFSCRWDSGQLGYIFYTKEQLRNMMGIKRITKKVISEVEKQLVNDVKYFDAQWNGDYYYFNIKDEDENIVDGCGGFLCVDNDTNLLSESIFEHISDDYGLKVEDVKESIEN